MISYEELSVPVDSIIIPESRQRTADSAMESHIQALAGSILRQGLIHPILVTGHTPPVLVAGWCRLHAYKHLHELTSDPRWASIPCHLASDVNEEELRILELEENTRRRQLHWKDEVKAVSDFHEAMTKQDTTWNQERSGEALGMHGGTISKYCNVARGLAEANPLVLNASSISSAVGALARQTERAITNEVERIMIIEEESEKADIPDAPFPPAPPRPEILCADFKRWAAEYKGSRFNFCHCDFPYGIGWDEAEKQGSGSFTKSTVYDDTQETYLQLLETLTAYQDQLFYGSAHIMFWLSGDFKIHLHAREIFESFGWTVNPFPFIWHKTDLVGIIPDSRRAGRRTYETALHVTRGDRKIISPVAMSFSEPSGRAQRVHISEKPDKVLRHFFRMYVDENTRMLDPTCGSGTSIRAAEYLGAEEAIGIELDPEAAETANVELSKFRRLKELQDQAAAQA